MGTMSSWNYSVLFIFLYVLFGLKVEVSGVDVESTTVGIECHSTHFECKNKVCIKPKYHCNGIDDCGDNSDEEGCGVKTLLKAPTSCPPDAYLCKTPAFCTTIDELCGDFNLCEDYDAIDRLCPFKCQPRKFKCHNVTQCISTKDICDGRTDCEDGSDELNCDDEKYKCREEPDSFLCDDLSSCIFAEEVCDGHPICDDGSDEKYDCYNQCQNKNCGENTLCVPKGRGVECICIDGFGMDKDGKCVGKEYCKASDFDRPCSQLCVEGHFGPSCRCVSGYKLYGDATHCNATGGEAVIYIGTSSAIHVWTVQSKEYSKLIDGLNTLTAIAVDSLGKRIFWAEMGKDQPEVFSMDLEGGAKTKSVVASFGLQNPVALAYDFITKNLYIVDSGTPAILACELQQNHCMTVFNSTVVTSPTEIVLNPVEGVLYYTEMGSEGKIMKGSMDGSSSEVFMTVNTHRPQSLEMDLTTSRLYWVEGLYQHLFKVDMDGKNRKPVLGYKVSSPNMISMFEDSIYWVSDNSNDIKVANKFTGDGSKTAFTVPTKPLAMAVRQQSLQTNDGMNRCSTSRCHNCLLSNKGSGTCFCLRGYKISYTGLYCEKNEAHAFLFASDKTRILRLNLNTTSRPTPSFLQNKQMTSIYTLAFLPKSNVMVYSDINSNGFAYITKMGLTNTSRTQDIASNLNSVSSLAVDEASQIVFWTDTVASAINVASLSGQYRIKLPIEADKPYAMAIHPVRGSLYFSELPTSSKPSVIKRCRLDGASCSTLVSSRLLLPTYLVAESHTLYWSDAGLGEINTIDEWGSDRQTLVVTRGRPLSFAIDLNILYWTEEGESSILFKHTHKEGGFEGKVAIEGNQLTGLVAVIPHELPQSACSFRNGGCEHICISIKRAVEVSCFCTEGYTLAEDGKKCILVEAEECNGFFCARQGRCIDSSKMCDGIEDCNDGSDEGENCKLESTCSDLEFTCDNGRCISEHFKCDGENDCQDGSDEISKHCSYTCDTQHHRCDGNKCIPILFQCDKFADCDDKTDELFCNNECERDEFFCSENNCIPKSWVCDGEDDCAEGDDEKECKPLSCGKDEFKCNSNDCIEKLEVCDGIENCIDGEDELDCPPMETCYPEEFSCYDGECIHKTAVCDDINDCSAREDELMCENKCHSNQFQCVDGSCVGMHERCNGMNDCTDGSDEQDCLSVIKKKQSADVVPTCDGFYCGLGQCVDISNRCDGKSDCRDNTDELNCRTTCKTADKLCSQICVDTFSGIECGCEAGYGLMEDRRTCEDVDECAERNAGCSHQCINMKGLTHNGHGFKCICHNGFVRGQDFFSCKAFGKRPELYVATASGVKKLSIEGRMQESVVAATETVSRMDIDVRRDIVYWTGYNTLMTEMQLWRKMSGSQPEVLFQSVIVDIAVDWITGNIYVMQKVPMSNSFDVKISVVGSNGLDKSLVTVHESAPTLVLHPKRGVMFWIASQPHASIIKASMDGYGAHVMTQATRHMHKEVTILSLDETTERLYWVHPVFGQLKSMSVKNKDVYTYDLSTNARLFVSMDLFEGVAYLTSPSDNTVQSFATANQGKKGMVTIGKVSHPGRIKVHHDLKQPLEYNACDVKECMYMCIVAEHGATCVCPDKFVSEASGNCEGPPKSVSHLYPLPQAIPTAIDKVIHKFISAKSHTTVSSLSKPNRNKIDSMVDVVGGYDGQGSMNRPKPKQEVEPKGSVENNQDVLQKPQTENPLTDGRRHGCGNGCLNKGVCIGSGTDSQYCRCAEGYIGQFCEKQQQKIKIEEESGSLTWLVGLFIGLAILAFAVIAGVCYLRYKRRGDALTSSIRFKKQKQFVICNQDDKDTLVPEISFGNPGFQEEIDEEAHMQEEQEWWKKLISRSRRSVDSAFHSKNGSDEGIDGYLKGDPHDVGMSDKIRLL